MGNEAISRTTDTFGDVFGLAKDERFRPDLLEWLIRLPLQRAGELARCLGVSNSTAYEQLAIHRSMGAIDHIVLAEPGTRAHRRYYASDLGLHAFALRHDPPYQVRALAQAAPVGARDLYELILHQETLTLLTELVSRLVSEGRPGGHARLLDLQHPATLTYRDQGRKHTLISDALLTLQRKEGSPRTFCLFIDACEQSDQQCSLGRNWLTQLAEVRTAFIGHPIPFPYPLIVTTPDRLHSWGTLLAQLSRERGERVLPGGITCNTRVKEGAYAPIWWSLADLAEQSRAHAQGGFERIMTKEKGFSLTQVLDKTAISPMQAQRLPTALPRPTPPGVRPPRNRSIARFVGGNFREEAAGLSPLDLLSERIMGADLTRLFALLTLKLSALEKSLLALLARHPLLSVPDLSILLAPEAKTSRTIGEHVTHLLRLRLLHIYEWEGGSSREERERYKLTEIALRFLAERYNLSPRYYLTLRKEEEENLTPGSPKTRWVQRGVSGLEAQAEHTIGFYRCMVAATRMSNEQRDHSILSWKSAFESVRQYPVPLKFTRSQLRPDGEVCYTAQTFARPRTFLIEYDRATSYRREYKKKFAAYHDYVEATKLIPPPILAITQSTGAARKMREVAFETDPRLTVLAILEEDLLREGLHTCIERAEWCHETVRG